MEDADWGDVDGGRELAAAVEGAELYLYPGDAHVFTDRSLDVFEEAAAALVRERALAFLGRLG
jgi:dienelactone hydrolase